MYGSWDTEWEKQNFFGSFFALLPPSNDHENQNFEKKWKKCLEILSFYAYMYTINEDHMIYVSSNIRCDRQNFLSFWAIFCPVSPLTNWKIKILKLKKTPRDIIILHICTINDNYDVWFLRYGARQTEFFVILDCFLTFYAPMDSENQNF